jgi:hypothetical protein
MALCEKLPTCASPLLLYAQEIEPRAGRVGHPDRRAIPQSARQDCRH